MREREALAQEHQRIGEMLERSQSEARKAGELDTMYREFNAFEQFVADHLTPQLSDYTGELLRAITEGKYDQVVFTGNYGIEVFDGDQEHFPVAEFSGGEDLETVVRLADAAMYDEKAQRRRSRAVSPLPLTG